MTAIKQNHKNKLMKHAKVKDEIEHELLNNKGDLNILMAKIKHKLYKLKVCE